MLEKPGTQNITACENQGKHSNGVINENQRKKKGWFLK